MHLAENKNIFSVIAVCSVVKTDFLRAYQVCLRKEMRKFDMLPYSLGYLPFSALSSFPPALTDHWAILTVLT
jgi:hypothetical protein